MATDTLRQALIINKMTKAQYDALQEKSDTELYLIPDVVDNTPTSGSQNYVTSDGIYNALADKANKSEMKFTNGSGANADKVTIQLKSGTTSQVLRTHQPLSNLISSNNKLSADLIADGTTNKVLTAAKKDKLDKAEIPYEKQYLTFVIIESGILDLRHWASSLSYSLDDGDTWTSITPNQSVQISLTAGNKLIWKGITDSNDLDGIYWEIDGESTTIICDIQGNIMSLLFGDNFIGQTSLVGTQRVEFRGSGVRSAKNLILPATTLINQCYDSMFYNCTNLIDAPELPATTLTIGCYESMFAECTNLRIAPELPATTLANYCYLEMFWGCRQLNYIKCLALYMATDCTEDWVSGVSETGTFVRAENMDRWRPGTDGIPPGWIEVNDKGTIPVEKNEFYDYQLNFNQQSFVDLGLPSGTLWGYQNIGASFDTDYGYHYQYGKGTDIYGITESDPDYPTHENPLAFSADTARQSWGGDWHMPTKAQIQELVDYTTCSWETDYKGSGHNGAKFTGPNGRSIFFPAAGCYVDLEGQEHEYGTEVCVWSSTPYGSDSAWYLQVSENLGVSFDDQAYYYYSSGFSVRPVIEPKYIPKYATVEDLSTKENIVPIQTISSGTTLAAQPNKLYKFSNAISNLTVTLAPPTITDKVSVYIFRFCTASSVTNIQFNVAVGSVFLEPDNLTWDTDTEYEVSIMFDGDYVMSYNKYVVRT